MYDRRGSRRAGVDVGVGAVLGDGVVLVAGLDGLGDGLAEPEERSCSGGELQADSSAAAPRSAAVEDMGERRLTRAMAPR